MRHVLGKRRLGLVERERRGADDRALLHVEVHLRAGDRVRVAGRLHLRADREEGRRRTAHQVRVVADARADPAGARAAVPELQVHRVVRMTGLHPHGPGDRAPVQGHGGHVGLVLGHLLRRDAELLGGARAHDDDVVPGDLVEGLGQFLQPRVVGKAAVVDARVGAEGHLEGVRRGGGRRRRYRRRGTDGHGRGGRAVDEAVVHRAPPELVAAGEGRTVGRRERSGAVGRIPVGLDRLEGRRQPGCRQRPPAPRAGCAPCRTAG